MLQPILERLNKKNIILASGSPRRKEILTALGLKYISVPSLFEENLDKSSFSGASEYAKETAKQKAVEVFNRIKQFMDKIIEKPKDEDNAIAMLQSLSGKTHTVHSGVTFLRPDKLSGKEEYSILQFDEITKVTFGSLTEEIIKMYVETKEPLDKAGGYPFI